MLAGSLAAQLTETRSSERPRYWCWISSIPVQSDSAPKALAPMAHGVEIDTGNPDWSVRLDNTVKYNYGVRTESADKRMLATPNNNDGDYNFRKAGTNITNRIDLLTEMDVVYKNNMGFRVSAASWYDKAYENTGSNSNPFVNGNGSTSGLVANDPRLAGVELAAQMCAFGEPIRAQQALEAGILDAIIDGDLLTGDNDCDKGDEERLVHVVQGGDSGWRVGCVQNAKNKKIFPKLNCCGKVFAKISPWIDEMKSRNALHGWAQSA